MKVDRVDVELREPLMVFVKTAGEDGDADIELGVVLVDLDDGRGAGGRRRTEKHFGFLELHAFGFELTDELHEFFCADDADDFFASEVFVGVHKTQASSDGLFGQDVAFGLVGTQAYDGGYIADIPTFFQHHHRDDGAVWLLAVVDGVGEFS